MYPILKSTKITRHLIIMTWVCLSLGYGNLAVAAATSGLSSLGDPFMYASAAKIDVFENRHFFTTDDRAYPSRTVTDRLDDTDADAAGQISAFDVYGPAPGYIGPKNTADAYANKAGVFYSGADLRFPYPENAGALSEAIWAQSFVKNTADAQFKFTISDAQLKATALGAGTVVEFTTDVGLYVGAPAALVSIFHQHAGIYAFTAGPSVQQLLTAVGPMTYSTTTPDAYTKEVDFNAYTGYVDLSSILVGQEFTVDMHSMALAMGKGEVSRGSAYFRDPVDLTGGFQIEASGLTATNNPIISSVPLPAPFWLFLSGIGALLTRFQRN